MRWGLRILAAAMALAWPATAAAASAESASAVDRVQSVFAAWARQHRLDGATLAVTVRGRLVLTACYGRRAANDRVPLASLSKAITAACKAGHGKTTRAKVRKQIAKAKLKSSLLGFPVAFRKSGELTQGGFGIYKIQKSGKFAPVG